MRPFWTALVSLFLVLGHCSVAFEGYEVSNISPPCSTHATNCSTCIPTSSSLSDANTVSSTFGDGVITATPPGYNDASSTLQHSTTKFTITYTHTLSMNTSSTIDAPVPTVSSSSESINATRHSCATEMGAITSSFGYATMNSTYTLPNLPSSPAVSGLNSVSTSTISTTIVSNPVPNYTATSIAASSPTTSKPSSPLLAQQNSATTKQPGIFLSLLAVMLGIFCCF